MRVMFNLVLLAVMIGVFLTIPGLYEARQAAKQHFADASQRIETTIADGKTTLDLSGLAHLRELPESILQLGGLTNLNVSETEISSLDKIGQLTRLERLNLRGSLVRDLEPLTGLPKLTSLDIGKTRVRDLEPLTKVGALEWVDIGDTEILSLEPATRIPNLRWINLHRSYAHDGSRVHYDWLFANVAEVFNGSAFEQNYTPDPRYLREAQLNRLADTLYLPQPFPRP